MKLRSGKTLWVMEGAVQCGEGSNAACTTSQRLGLILAARKTEAPMRNAAALQDRYTIYLT